LISPQKILIDGSAVPSDKAYATAHTAPAVISTAKAVAPGVPRRRQARSANQTKKVAARNKKIAYSVYRQSIILVHSGEGSLWWLTARLVALVRYHSCTPTRFCYVEC
jgi:hypothetical protein